MIDNYALIGLTLGVTFAFGALSMLCLGVYLLNNLLDWLNRKGLI